MLIVLIKGFNNTAIVSKCCGHSSLFYNFNSDILLQFYEICYGHFFNCALMYYSLHMYCEEQFNKMDKTVSYKVTGSHTPKGYLIQFVINITGCYQDMHMLHKPLLCIM